MKKPGGLLVIRTKQSAAATTAIPARIAIHVFAFLTPDSTNQILDPTHGLRASKNVDPRSPSRPRHNRRDRGDSLAAPLFSAGDARPPHHFAGRWRDSEHSVSCRRREPDS